MFHYERESRTPQSECFLIENEEASMARADLHYTPAVVYGTLCVPESWSEADIQDVIADIDDRIVRTADPFREDFVVTVWAGRRYGAPLADGPAGHSARPTRLTSLRGLRSLRSSSSLLSSSSLRSSRLTGRFSPNRGLPTS